MSLKLLLSGLLYLIPAISIAQPCNLQPSTQYSPDTPCTRRPMQLFGNASVSGVNYSWTGPFGYTSSVQNPVINSVTTLNAGKYILTVSKPGCNTEYDTLDVNSIMETPIAYPIQVLNNVCIGDTLTLVVSFYNLGVHPCCFNWITPRGTFIKSAPWDKLYLPNATYADTGMYKLVVVPTSGCLACIGDTSYLRVTDSNITPVSPVTVSISANPAIISGTIPVQFTASLPASGYKFQWRKNGVNISGATNRTYIGYSNIDFTSGDNITVWAQRTGTCVKDTISAPYTINLQLSIEAQFAKSFSISPNPNNGTFSIKGSFSEPASLQLMNMLGEVVYREQMENNALTNKEIVLPANIATGTYILKISSGQQTGIATISIAR